MSRWIRRILLVSVFAGALLTMSSGTAPVGYCQSCPEARLSEGNFVKCLDGQNAWCKSGPSCGCNGPVKKDNQCGGACGVRTNWGACAVECAKGRHGTCKQGGVKWIGMQQKLIDPICECGGMGGVSKIDSQNNDDTLAFSDRPDDVIEVFMPPVKAE